MIEKTDRVDLVSEELDAIGQLRVRRKDVHDPAAHRKRTGGLHRVLPVEIPVGEEGDQGLHRKRLSPLQPPLLPLERARVRRALDQRLNARHDHGARREPPVGKRLGHHETITRNVVA